MRPDRDIDVLLDAWLAEGPVEAPDRILDTVADRVHRRRPEPAWRLAWRDSRMNTVIKPVLAAAAVVVLSLVGIAVILGPPSIDVGGPGATPTPAPSPSPSPSPSTSPSEGALCQPDESSCRGPLAAGVHRTDVVVTPFTFEVPDGWSKEYDEPGVVSLVEIGWSGFLGIWPDPVAVDQEICTSNADTSVGRSVEDLVAWLTQHPGLTTTEPVSTELGGLGGWTLEAEMREGWEPGPCPGRVSLFSHAGTEVADPFFWDIDADRRMRLTILDAGDHTVMIDVEADKADFDAVVAEAAPIVESFVFE